MNAPRSCPARRRSRWACRTPGPTPGAVDALPQRVDHRQQREDEEHREERRRETPRRSSSRRPSVAQHRLAARSRTRAPARSGRWSGSRTDSPLRFSCATVRRSTFRHASGSVVDLLRTDCMRVAQLVGRVRHRRAPGPRGRRGAAYGEDVAEHLAAEVGVGPGERRRSAAPRSEAGRTLAASICALSGVGVQPVDELSAPRRSSWWRWSARSATRPSTPGRSSALRPLRQRGDGPFAGEVGGVLLQGPLAPRRPDPRQIGAVGQPLNQVGCQCWSPLT